PETVDNIEVVRTEYEAVRAMTPHGPKFNQGLRQGYLDYGDLQYDGSDYKEFVHFAFKAVDSAKGEDVLPDEVNSRVIPAGLTDEFTLSRARLMGALEQGGRRNAPWKAADAQTAFDCWLERTEEEAEATLIDECKGRFAEALAAVENSLTREASGAHLVFFPFDQANLTPVALTVIEQVVKDLNAENVRSMVVAGHTDSSGSDSYNDALSKSRAEAVAAALADRGIDDGVQIRWFGERQPRVSLPDGTREQENRRVEIISQ
ncbi:MAG: OmpA family protein, partial [Geminicoccaceae bacterium]